MYHDAFLTQQGGGMIFKGNIKKRKMRGAGFFSFAKPISFLKKHFQNKIKNTAMEIAKKTGKTLLDASYETATDILSGKKKPKQAVKDSFKKTKNKLIKDSAGIAKKKLFGGRVAQKRKKNTTTLDVFGKKYLRQ